jgi:hypothetical protein
MRRVRWDPQILEPRLRRPWEGGAAGRFVAPRAPPDPAIQPLARRTCEGAPARYLTGGAKLRLDARREAVRDPTRGL